MPPPCHRIRDKVKHYMVTRKPNGGAGEAALSLCSFPVFSFPAPCVALPRPPRRCADERRTRRRCLTTGMFAIVGKDREFESIHHLVRFHSTEPLSSSVRINRAGVGNGRGQKEGGAREASSRTALGPQPLSLNLHSPHPSLPLFLTGRAAPHRNMPAGDCGGRRSKPLRRPPQHRGGKGRRHRLRRALDLRLELDFFLRSSPVPLAQVDHKALEEVKNIAKAATLKSTAKCVRAGPFPRPRTPG